MKNTKFAAAAIALPTLSFGVSATEPASSTQAQNMSKVGVAPADGATTLDGLGTKLAERANAADATSYSVTSATGKDKMSGTAAVYK